MQIFQCYNLTLQFHQLKEEKLVKPQDPEVTKPKYAI